MYKEVFMKTHAGQYVLADLCRHGFLDRSTFNPNSDRLTSLNEGKRAMAIHILNMCLLNPNEYVKTLHLQMSQNEDDVDYLGD